MLMKTPLQVALISTKALMEVGATGFYEGEMLNSRERHGARPTAREGRCSQRLKADPFVEGHRLRSRLLRSRRPITPERQRGEPKGRPERAAPGEILYSLTS